MRDGCTGASVQHGAAARAARPTSYLSCDRTSMLGPHRRGGFFGVKFSSRPDAWKFGVKRFLVLREVLAGKWGGLFWATSFGKNFRRRRKPRSGLLKMLRAGLT